MRFGRVEVPISSGNPCKGRHLPGEVILVCVCWYLRYLVHGELLYGPEYGGC